MKFEKDTSKLQFLQVFLVVIVTVTVTVFEPESEFEKWESIVFVYSYCDNIIHKKDGIL